MSTVDGKPASDAPPVPPVASTSEPLRPHTGAAAPSPKDPTVILGSDIQPTDVPATLDPMRTDIVPYEFADPARTQLAPRHFQADEPVVYGEYEIEREIARGGMGVVYRARHRKLNRVVALKTLLEGQGASDAQVKRFHLEATAAARLQHPNIVQIFEVGEARGIHFFAMEYVEGRTFLDVIEKEKVTAMVAAEIVRKIAGALAFAHDQRILHRDIKPQNILVDARGEPKLSDFGLAKDFTRQTMLTQSGVALGTPMYMSPEQAMGRSDQIDHRSDIYSLGAVLYHALTRRPPFEGDSPLSIMNQVVVDDPKPIQAPSCEVDRDLETICLHAMAKDPAHRYATARDLAEDLERWSRGAKIRARRPGWLNWLVRRARKHKVKTLAALVVLCAAAVALVGWEAHLALRRQQAVETVTRELNSTRTLGRFRGKDLTFAAMLEHIGEVREGLARAQAAVEEAQELDPGCTEAVLLEAELHARRGDQAAAAEAYARYAALRPQDADEARYQRARALHGEGRLEEASRELDDLERTAADPGLRAIARARHDLIARANDPAAAPFDPAGVDLAHRHEALRLAALALGSRGSDQEKSKAAAMLESCLDFGPGSADDFLQIAFWYAKSKQPASATLSAYVNAAALAETIAIPLLEAGKYCLHEGAQGRDARTVAGWQARASDFFGLYEKLKPGTVHAFLTQAEFHAREPDGDPEKAEACYRRAGEIDPNNAAVPLKLLCLYHRHPQRRDPAAFYGEVRAALLAADEKRLFNAPMMQELVEVLLGLGLDDEAQAWIARGLGRADGDADLHVSQGILHYRRDRFDDAVASFTRAIDLQPDQYKNYVWRARGFVKLKDSAKAIVDLSQAIELSPQNRDLYLRRGIGHMQLLRINEALADIEQVALLSTVEEMEQIRTELVSPVPSQWFENLSPGVRQAAAGLLPRLEERLVKRGEAALRERDWDRVKDVFERARVVAPGSWRPLLGLAVVWAHRREWEYAAHLLVQAIDRGLKKRESIEGSAHFEALRARPEYDQVKARLSQMRD